MKKCYEYGPYTVVIADIINSKKISDRKDVQNKLKQALNNINENYAEDIASKFTITLGDEFQGLLKSRNNIMHIINEIEMEMTPISFRFGIGIGEISTDINYQYSYEIDGSAYHRARSMIDELKRSENQYLAREANILISSQDNKTEIDSLINSILSVCTALKSKWTTRQKEIIYAYLISNENQYKTAEELEITQSSVNKSLNKASFYTFKAAIDNVSTILAKKEED